jgi:hypothetical protein
MLNQNDNFSIASRASHAALVEEQFTSLLRAGLGKVTSEPLEAQDTVGLSALLSETGVSGAEWAECYALVESDNRFAFLGGLAHSTAVAIEAANSLELSLFGNAEELGPCIVAPLQAFIRVLDGLVDDVPEIFSSQKENILTLVQFGLGETNIRNVRKEDECNHIVIDLLYKIALTWTGVVRSTPGFSDPSIRAIFLQAVDKAMRAEYFNANCIIDGYPSNIEALRDSVRAKSADVAWVIALIPILVRGWPLDLDRNEYHSVANLFGTYVGWVDDICDVLEDLDQGRWSDVLLELYSFSCKSTMGSPAATKYEFSELLKNDDCRAHLVKIGVAHQVAFFDMLVEIGADPMPIAKLVAHAL